ncbi:MAG: dicarboxylate/amino acid:cation symporter [Alphaproteobacteria bacterium]|nr:MAG: dicarboxylate/amino acid:cation symporter [Alphaproteobacteria bacterium]
MFQKYSMIISIIIGVILGMYGPEVAFGFAGFVSTVFMRLLKFVSLPIISLSIASTIANLDKNPNAWLMTRHILFYTILTTVLSATLGLGLFELAQPVEPSEVPQVANAVSNYSTYSAEFVKIFPDNIVKPFLDFNVIGVLIISAFIGLASLALPKAQKQSISNALNLGFAMIMQITKWILKLLPFAVVAFIMLFMKDLGKTFEVGALAKYLGVITAANLIHGALILPLILVLHRIPVLDTFKGMFPTLSLAFFTKSGAAAIPTAIQNSEENLGVSPEVSRITFPLCTTINMNACAAFILVTFLFVATSHGVVFTLTQKILWILIATIVAIGNAGVPMGCFFLTNALLSSFNVPVELMGVILPFYGVLDMLETSINLWSDSCVTVIVDKWWKRNQG